LLVEASGQNLALQSEAFNVSGTWTLVTGGTGVNPAVTANAVISPDGTQNAETVVFNRGAGNTVSDQSTLEQILTLAASGTYTFSVYAKATTSGDVGKQIFLRAGSAGSLIAYTLTSSWVRLSRIETSIASGSNVVQIGSRGGFTADNSVSVDLWGAQVETGAIPTSYIPTTTAAVSRAADTIIASGALVSSLIGQTEGVLYCEFTLSSISDVIVVPNAYNSAQNYVGILHNGTNSLVLRIRYRSGGSNLNINFTQVATIGTTYKVAIGYKSGDSAAFVNGVQVGSTDTTAFAFENPLTLIEILVRQFYSSALFGPNRIRAVALYTTRLSNDQLAELTRLT
jgi:hypothetical protein